MSNQALPDGVARARDVFFNALDQPSSERAAFVAKACGGDGKVRAEAEELLRRHEGLGGFLETPAIRSEVRSKSRLSLLATDGLGKAGERIGRYRLVEKLGEGGWGVVYRAEQEEPVRREVALKIIKLGMDTRAVIARFEAERQAVAMMDHPGIAKALDAGSTETGRPYFVMELVRGARITEYCDENHLSTEDRLMLFVQVCNAIQHAHQKGVIHRDIKPSNILVAIHDGVPVPKVIDFGIVKATERSLTDQTAFTEFRSFVGTPAYMSPEQAEMSGIDIDTRSDIYTLGVLLYEMLTGTTPFDATELMNGGLDKCRRTIRETEPAAPSARLTTLRKVEATTTAGRRHTTTPRLVRTLRGELDWIVMKCLEKDRRRRYATAADLAADVQRYLEGEAVLARAPTNVYRFRKFVWRHRVLMFSTAAVTITLLAGTGVSAWLAVRASRAERREAGLRHQAEQERAVARLNEYVADINLAKQSLDSGNYGRAIQLLKKHRPGPGEPDLRGFAWGYLWNLARGDEDVDFPSQVEPVNSVAFSPNAEWLAVGSEHGLKIWNVLTRTLVTRQQRAATSMAFLPDGKSFLVAGQGLGGEVRVLSTEDWSERSRLAGSSGPIALAYEAARMAAATREGVRVWDTETWRPMLLFRDAGPPFTLSSDGSRLVADARSGAGLKVWNLEGEAPEVMLKNSSNLFARFRTDRAVAFSKDGATVVAARNVLSRHGVFVLGLWNTQTGQEAGAMPEDPERIEHTSDITSIAVSPNGQTVATASKDYSIRLWDYGTSQCRATLQGHLNEVSALAFSSNGQFIASGSRDGAVKLWPTNPRPRLEELAGARLPLGLSPNGDLLAALTRDNRVVFLDLATGAVAKEFPLRLPPAAGAPGNVRVQIARSPVVSGDLKTLVAALPDGWIKIWDTESGQSRSLHSPDQTNARLALSADGRTLVSGGRSLCWWDLSQGTNMVRPSRGNWPMFSGDGRTLVVFGRDSSVEIWDASSRELIHRFQIGSAPIFGASGGPAAVSPDGSRVAIAGANDSIELWDTGSGRMLESFVGHKQNVTTIVFCPDGKTLASSSDDSTLKFWNLASQQELLTIRRLGGAFRALTLSPDGRALVAGTSSLVPGGGVRVFRAASVAEIDAAESRRRTRSEDF